MRPGIVIAFHGAPGRLDPPVLDPFISLVKARYPGAPVVALPFAGPRHPGPRPGGHCNPVEAALLQLAQAGADRAVVQPMHVVCGEEYDALAACLAEVEGKAFPRGRIVLGAPLLSGPDDVNAVALGLTSELAPNLRGRAVVLMGHGSQRPAQEAYENLAACLARLDPALALATLKQPCGAPLSIEAVRDRLKVQGVTRADLVPLTFTVGGHARQDMAGDRPGSFRDVLARAGLDCRPVLVGLHGRQAVLRIWLAHLEAAMAALGPDATSA